MSNSTSVSTDDRASAKSNEDLTTAIGALVIALSIVAVVLRFYTRFTIIRTGFDWDDWFVLLALIFLVAAGVCVLIGRSKFSHCIPNY